MSWNVSWYLERQGHDGVWQLLSQPILLHKVAIEKDCSDEVSMYDLDDVDNFISYHLANEGFPADASESLSLKVDKLVDHAASEFLTFPLFGWILVQSLIDTDWAGTAVNPVAKFPTVWQSWLKQLNLRGDPEKLRFVFLWTR